MKIHSIYPEAPKAQRRRSDLLAIARWPFLVAAFCCPLLNLLLRGKAWSVVVLWGMRMLWRMLFSPDVIEYNRISQMIKLVAQSCILLVLIERLLAPGWAAETVPLVCAGGLLVVGVLLFTDLERQRRNMLPFLLLLGVALVAGIGGVCVLQPRWPFWVLGSVALGMLIGCFSVLGLGVMAREIAKMFHTE